jgi:hypothetical protein
MYPKKNQQICVLRIHIFFPDNLQFKYALSKTQVSLVASTRKKQRFHDKDMKERSQCSYHFSTLSKQFKTTKLVC